MQAVEQEGYACRPSGAQKLLRVHFVKGSSIPSAATKALMLLYWYQNLQIQGAIKPHYLAADIQM